MMLYKHRNCTDVAVEVLKKYYIPEKDAYALKVLWVRVSTPRNKVLWSLGITQRLKISRQEWLHGWLPFPS